MRDWKPGDNWNSQAEVNKDLDQGSDSGSGSETPLLL